MVLLRLHDVVDRRILQRIKRSRKPTAATFNRDRTGRERSGIVGYETVVPAFDHDRR